MKIIIFKLIFLVAFKCTSFTLPYSPVMDFKGCQFTTKCFSLINISLRKINKIKRINSLKKNSEHKSKLKIIFSVFLKLPSNSLSSSCSPAPGFAHPHHPPSHSTSSRQRVTVWAALVELILKLTFSSPFPDSSAKSIWIKRVWPRQLAFGPNALHQQLK